MNAFDFCDTNVLLYAHVETGNRPTKRGRSESAKNPRFWDFCAGGGDPWSRNGMAQGEYHRATDLRAQESVLNIAGLRRPQRKLA